MAETDFAAKLHERFQEYSKGGPLQTKKTILRTPNSDSGVLFGSDQLDLQDDYLGAAADKLATLKTIGLTPDEDVELTKLAKKDDRTPAEDELLASLQATKQPTPEEQQQLATARAKLAEAAKKAKVVERSEVNRFERGQILAAYKLLRQEIHEASKRGENAAETTGLLQKFRDRARQLEKDLDELNRQYYENLSTVTIETPEIGRHEVPVVLLDLHPKALGETDDRVPDYFINPYISNPHQTAAFTMARALEGHKVYAPYPPETEQVSNEGWGKRLWKNGTFALHAQYHKEIIKSLGANRVNLVGASFGGGVALAVASDEEFTKQYINDLVVLEPVGLQNRSIPGIAWGFGVVEGFFNTARKPEANAKAWAQGGETFKKKGFQDLLVANMLRKKQLGHAELATIHPQGRYQVWVGTESPVASAHKTTQAILLAERARRTAHIGTTPVEIYQVQGGKHSFPFINYLGVSAVMDGPRPETHIVSLQPDELENSATAMLLRRLSVPHGAV